MVRRRESLHFHFGPTGSSSSNNSINDHQLFKDQEDMKPSSSLKKWTSWSYLSQKLKENFSLKDKKKKKRDTMICEEDEEDLLYYLHDHHEYDGDEEETKQERSTSYGDLRAPVTTTKRRRATLQFGSSSSHEIIGYEELLNCCMTTTTTPPTSSSTTLMTTSSMMANARAIQLMEDRTEDLNYEPSKELRWCINCSKCFQRQLSHYDKFCGLDCKTAYKFR